MTFNPVLPRLPDGPVSRSSDRQAAPPVHRCLSDTQMLCPASAALGPQLPVPDKITSTPAPTRAGFLLTMTVIVEVAPQLPNTITEPAADQDGSANCIFPIALPAQQYTLRAPSTINHLPSPIKSPRRTLRRPDTLRTTATPSVHSTL